jgi:hypothetical protein
VGRGPISCSFVLIFVCVAREIVCFFCSSSRAGRAEGRFGVQNFFINLNMLSMSHQTFIIIDDVDSNCPYAYLLAVPYATSDTFLKLSEKFVLSSSIT